MWNILIVIIIAVVLNFANTKYNFIQIPKFESSVKQEEVNNVVNDAVSITRETRRRQQEEVEAATR